MYIRIAVNGTTQAVVFSIRSNPFAQYICYVTANTSVGEGTPSKVFTGRTGESGEQKFTIIYKVIILNLIFHTT